jgi:lysozyme
VGLRDKLRKRRRALRRQTRLWKKTGKTGHAKAAKRHARAVRYLRNLIQKSATESDTSPAGLQFISEFEGYFSHPYNDPVGYATVGIGHLIGYRAVRPSDSKLIWVQGQKKPGQLTRAEAERLLAQDLAKDYEPAVRRLFLPGGPLAGKFEQSLFDALVSFAYNLGPGSVTPGTRGFETIGRAISAGDRKAIAEAVLLYDKAGGKALPGLTRRRRAERRLILTGDYG